MRLLLNAPQAGVREGSELLAGALGAAGDGEQAVGVKGGLEAADALQAGRQAGRTRVKMGGRTDKTGLRAEAAQAGAVHQSPEGSNDSGSSSRRPHAGKRLPPAPPRLCSTALTHRAVLGAGPKVLGARWQQVHPGRGAGEIAVGLAALWAVPARAAGQQGAAKEATMRLQEERVGGVGGY
jgi:hypothetical protein